MVELNVAEKDKYQYLKDDDLNIIELDKILYREYIQKEEQLKKQRKRKERYLRNKQLEEENSQLNINGRLKCTYQKYIDGDTL
jgi:hypothetical protein